MKEPPRDNAAIRAAKVEYMARARTKSKQPLGIARLKLAHARRAVERVERVYQEQSFAQRKRLERCQAEVDYLLSLERIEAGEPDDTAYGE